MFIRKPLVVNLAIPVMLSFGVCFLFFSYFFPHAQGERKAQLLCEPNDIDFGDVITGQSLSCELKITNAGDNVLIIDGLATSCGCTSGEFSQKTLAPNDVAYLKSSIDTSRKTGPFHGRLTIYSNSVEDQQHVITFRANILSPLQFDNDYITFSDVPIAEEKEETIVVKSRIGKVKKIVAVPFQCDGVTAHCVFQNHGFSDKYTCKLFASAMKPGRFEFELQFVATSMADIDFVQPIRVHLNAPGPIIIEPESIWIIGDSDSSACKKVNIRSASRFNNWQDAFKLVYNKKRLVVSSKKNSSGVELLVRRTNNACTLQPDSKMNDNITVVVASKGREHVYTIPVHVLLVPQPKLRPRP